MKYRPLGRTGWMVSEISFGAWAIGGNWGHVSEEEALTTLDRAIDSGVNFIDTADVYGDGRSERLIADLRSGAKKRSWLLQKPVAVFRAIREGQTWKQESIVGSEGARWEGVSQHQGIGIRERGGRVGS